MKNFSEKFEVILKESKKECPSSKDPVFDYAKKLLHAQNSKVFDLFETLKIDETFASDFLKQVAAIPHPEKDFFVDWCNKDPQAMYHLFVYLPSWDTTEEKSPWRGVLTALFEKMYERFQQNPEELKMKMLRSHDVYMKIWGAVPLEASLAPATLEMIRCSPEHMGALHRVTMRSLSYSPYLLEAFFREGLTDKEAFQTSASLMLRLQDTAMPISLMESIRTDLEKRSFENEDDIIRQLSVLVYRSWSARQPLNIFSSISTPQLRSAQLKGFYTEAFDVDPETGEMTSFHTNALQYHPLIRHRFLDSPLPYYVQTMSETDMKLFEEAFWAYVLSPTKVETLGIFMASYFDTEDKVNITENAFEMLKGLNEKSRFSVLRAFMESKYECDEEIKDTNAWQKVIHILAEGLTRDDLITIAPSCNHSKWKEFLIRMQEKTLTRGISKGKGDKAPLRM